MQTIHQRATGHIVRAFGNLIHVEFSGSIRQGEVAYVLLGNEELRAEVLEIIGNEAKLQVFEDTDKISYNTPVRFTGDLLEAELGPGLLGRIFDGLQNPLENIAEQAGFFLPRGMYVSPIERQHHWSFVPKAKLGDIVTRGDTLGTVAENRFRHKIMVPFTMFDSYRISWIAREGSYTVYAPIAKVIDGSGAEHTITMLQKWPVKAPLMEGEKTRPTQLLDTGLRTIDTQFPIMKGGTFCTPGPFGAGKTMLQHHLSRYSSVDIVVIVACGERAGEVVEILREFPHLIDTKTNEPLLKRTVIICNTSSMPVAARESSLYMGVTIAEYYRQMGLDVLLLADSTSRWAQAMREMSGRLEEIPGEEAFPAYLSSRIASFYERSGCLALSDGSVGSLTIGGSVSPAGGNFEEPVTQSTLAVVGAFLGLSRERSDSRRYPAIDPLISWSKYLEPVAAIFAQTVPAWKDMVQLARTMLRRGDEIKRRMEVVGEEGVSIDDLVVHLKAELYDNAYLQQNGFDKEDGYFTVARQVCTAQMMHRILKCTYSFASHDEARSYFLMLQNKLKNLNYLEFGAQAYTEGCTTIERLFQQLNGKA